MDLLTLLDTYLIDPLSRQLFGIFDLNGRFGVLFLGISVATAYVLYLFRKRSGLSHARSFWQFLGGNQVNLHRSALLDYRYYFVRALLNLLLIVPMLALLAPHLPQARDYLAWFNQTWGEQSTQPESVWLALLYGLGLFLLRDFCHYWVHRAFHSRWLWEFHKVHHSAPVLVPATASRVHFVEKFANRLLASLCLAVYAGAFWYACGGHVSAYTLFGVTYLLFIFNALAANLRHSHVWLSFGPRLEHVINSPAQHQIHHSDAPRHFNKNFATNLSLWDWMFGTLYTTQATPEAIRFGTGAQDSQHYLTLYSLIITPFVRTARKLAQARRRAGAPHQANSQALPTERDAHLKPRDEQSQASA